MRCKSWWKGALLASALGAGGALAQQQPAPDWRRLSPEEARAMPDPKPPRVTTKLGSCPAGAQAAQEKPVTAAEAGRTRAKKAGEGVIEEPRRVTVAAPLLTAEDAYCQRERPSFGRAVPLRSSFAPELDGSTANTLGR